MFINDPHGLSFSITDPQIMKSFVTCIVGYYRLIVKWSIYFELPYYSTALKRLKDMKCHGPIGGQFSYNKLERNGNQPGSYILRQCEHVFGTYYIDIIVHNNKNAPETFRITENGNKFTLYKRDGSTEDFDKLHQVAECVDFGGGKHFRLAPSEFDRPQFLLLCAPPEQIKTTEIVNDLSSLKNSEPRIIKWQSLVLYKSK